MRTLIMRRRDSGAGAMRHAPRLETTVPATQHSPAEPVPAAQAALGFSDDSLLSHWVKMAYFTMRREMENALGALGLTLTQWRALGLLLHAPGTTHSDLVKTLEIEPPSVTSLVNGMERRGWVRQERSAADARVKRLFLTARGRRTIEAARAACGPVQQRMEDALGERDRESLKRLLRSVVDGLQ